MSNGDEARIESGKTWSDFCDRLRDAGDLVMRDSSPQGAFDRAEGFRYLSRITRAALETFVENADPRAPVLARVVHETAKMGSDNPDNFYQNASISGAYRYRISGTRGSVHYLSFGTQIGHYGKGAGMPPSGFLEGSDLTVDDAGRFEILVSCEPPEEEGADWLPMKPDTGTLIVRQTRLDREGERLADLSIERIEDGDPGPSEVTAAGIDAGLTQSGNLVAGAAMLFASWAEGFQKHTNELPEFDRKVASAVGGDPNIVYYHSYWALEPGQALVIDASPPGELDHWNFQLNNHWMESLDYRHHPIHVNSKTATYGADGSVRIVVAHVDPGVPNWIRTVGHERGTMCFRWVRATEHPQPQTRVMPVEDVAGLPA